MNRKAHGCATHRGNYPDDSAREALAWIAETEALILQMKDAPADPKLEEVLRLLEAAVARKRRMLREPR